MTCIGAGAMGIVMFLFMKGMYTNKSKNTSLILVSILVMGLSTYLVRRQKPIDNLKWMQAMIPHHSIAILTSKRAAI